MAAALASCRNGRNAPNKTPRQTATKQSLGVFFLIIFIEFSCLLDEEMLGGPVTAIPQLPSGLQGDEQLLFVRLHLNISHRLGRQRHAVKGPLNVEAELVAEGSGKEFGFFLEDLDLALIVTILALLTAPD